MADKKKGRKRKEEYIPPGGSSDDIDKPTKEEYTIAKWLRKNVPTKRTKFANHNVEFFSGYKAVDALMDSQWAKPRKADEIPFFTSRLKVVEYLDTMLRHKFFHRAKKIPVSEQELLKARNANKKLDKKTQKDADSGAEEKRKNNNGGETELKNEKSTETVEKKKRKVRLEMHLEQLFEDNADAYVWIYDPVPVYYWFFGTLLVLGAIGVCLFPLWPPSVRQGVYYLSLAAIGFLVFIIGLAVIRLIVFCLVWILTLGKHHLWLLPNLTQDVGFFASFWPLYQYEYKGGSDSKKDSKKKKKKKDKDSDAEDEITTRAIHEEEIAQKERQQNENEPTELISCTQPTCTPGAEDDRNSETDRQQRVSEESESESSSQPSSTGRDFEMVEREDLTT